MSGDEGAAGALVRGVVAALKALPELSQVADGAPIQAGDSHAVVDVGPETDWGYKGGVGAELRLAVVIGCGGERPGRARVLLERARAALAGVGPELEGWRLVTLVAARSRVVRSAGPGWTGTVEYRARMLRVE